MCQQLIGYISAKYESGNLGCGAISNGSGDPGGASYGTYQLASSPGTLQKFLLVSKYWPQFRGATPGSSAFNAQWSKLSVDPAFCLAQHDYIKSSHFDPIATYWVNTAGLDRSCKIDEMLWSLSVQHGYTGCCKIIDNGADNLPEPYIDDDAVKCMYKARCDYIDGLTMPSSTKQALHNRYTSEMADVLKIQD